MACTSVNLGRNESCKDNVGGIKNIYIGSWSSSIWDGLISNSSAYLELISGNDFSTVDVYKYELKSDANTFEETNEVSNENQTSFWTQTLTVSLKKQTIGTQGEIMKMSKGQVVVIIEDYNGTFRVAGLYRGLDVQANTTTGGAMGDMNGYTLTMTGVSPVPAPFVTGSQVPSDGGGLFDVQISQVISDN